MNDILTFIQIIVLSIVAVSGIYSAIFMEDKMKIELTQSEKDVLVTGMKLHFRFISHEWGISKSDLKMFIELIKKLNLDPEGSLIRKFKEDYKSKIRDKK